jgi:hypothetical protein
MSQVLLVIKAAYSSFITRRQDGSVRVAWTKVGTRDSDDDEVANSVTLSIGSRKPLFDRVVIG